MEQSRVADLKKEPEKSHGLEGAADIHKPKSESTESDRPEGEISKTHRPVPEGEESQRAEGGADKSHRPEREVTNSDRPENGSPEDEMKNKAVRYDLLCDSAHRQQLLSSQCEVVTGWLMVLGSAARRHCGPPRGPLAEGLSHSEL